MIRQRSCAGSAYHSRDFTNGYTNTYLPRKPRGITRSSSEYSELLRIPRNEYGICAHRIRPLCASTTWNSWMRSRFSASETSSSSASPRVPTSEKLCSRCPSAKSSHAAANSRLSCARRSPSRRRHAGSSFRNVYLTKRRALMCPIIAPPGPHAGPVGGGPRDLPGGIECVSVRIALLSPYSWTYPGGVTRHIEALAAELAAAGHEPRILAPFDPDDARSRRLHRGARPQPRSVGEDFVSLGRTIGVPANGAVSNMAITPDPVFALRRELRRGRYDILHIHEPVVPFLSWDALTSAGELPLVGTFHTYSENVLTNGLAAGPLGGRRRMNHLHARIAVSEAAAWTARRFYGGRYRIIPNGVQLPPAVEREVEPS